ncbi:MAG: twin-arginine translocase subunit TatC [Alphaproteobacteria bacterium]|nr:twin-arginine translocase subunit TatC [Alphaproteobacteria bacterium]
MKMTIVQHLSELKKRILWIMLFFAGAAVVGFFVAPFVQEILLQPLIASWPGGTILYTRVTDGLLIEFKLALLFAIFATLPFVIYHLWRFVRPGLHKNEQRLILPMLVLSPVLFICGAAFAYFVIFPVIFEFFISLNHARAMPSMLLPAAADYLDFTIGLLRAFGLAFQLPLVLVLLNRVGVLSRTSVVKSRKFAIVGIFAAAAVLTPPDIMSQILLALPLLALFEISILFMKKERM